MTIQDPKQVQIRPAAPSDVAALVDMRLRINSHMIDRNAETWRMSEQQKRMQKGVYLTDLANDQKRLLVAADGDGTLVGMSVGSIQRHEQIEPTVAGRIDDVWGNKENGDGWEMDFTAAKRRFGVAPGACKPAGRVDLLERIKIAANKRDVPYQSLIKVWLSEKIDSV